jgi:hypothetical protein
LQAADPTNWAFAGDWLKLNAGTRNTTPKALRVRIRIPGND